MISPFNWGKFPILRYCIFFITGIIFYRIIDFNIPIDVLVTSLFISFITLIIAHNKWPKRYFIRSLLSFFLLFGLGFFNAQINDQKNNPNHLINFDLNKEHIFRGRIIEEGKSTEKTNRYILQINELLDSNSTTKVSSDILLYVKKSVAVMPLEYGEELIVKAKIQEISPPLNQYSFNYKAYMAQQNIFHQVYIDSSDYYLTGAIESSLIMHFATSSRKYLKGIISEKLNSISSQGIAEALILGDKSNLASEIKTSFSQTGAIHVLAVSGLHVGIIYQFVIWLLSFIRKYPYTKFIIFGLSISSLLAFATITGFSPSVCRAALMFALVAFAEVIGRKSSIYNTIAFSAFIILMINPLMVYNLGFQLSYTAVFGIVYLYPKLYTLLKFKTYILDKIYALCCVSIAATISTIPLTLYYFHQFSNVFLLSNFLVIPLASGILISGLVLFAFAQIPLISSLIAYVLQFLIDAMHHGVAFLQSLPNAFISGIYFDGFDLIMLTSLFFLLVLILEFQKKTYLYLLSFIVLAYSGINILRDFKTEVQITDTVLSDGQKDYFIRVQSDSAEYLKFGKGQLNGDLPEVLKNYKRELRIAKINEMEAYQLDLARVWESSHGVFFQPFDTSYSASQIDWLYINYENDNPAIVGIYNPKKGFLLGNNIPFFSKQKILRELEIKKATFFDLSISGSLDLMSYGFN